ncbi:DUF2202 domain-containing protein [Maribellus sediminis]|uniref:DUF2202 domain-containing protein n=1 Tax=Maribellus sediminis TaxID=2696285 RepID=UPI0014316075|nr:DUF2202 domain-containing protein [Maribellus sediminis]
MKTQHLIFRIAILAVFIILSACSESPKDEELTTKSSQSQIVRLTQSEIDGLLFMREEEKLARDVYLTFYAKYGHQVFDNISQSEQVHTDAILRLINYYDLDDPFIDTIGVFDDPTLTALYAYLMALGDCCLDSALVVGAIIEETDMVDIEKRALDTDVQNITLVYENLLNGSENHLRAFVKDLAMLGIDYQPRILSEERFDEIINN